MLLSVFVIEQNCLNLKVVSKKKVITFLEIARVLPDTMGSYRPSIATCGIFFYYVREDFCCRSKI